MKPNPFSLYDFLGYFTPGAVTIYVALLSIGFLSPQESAIAAITERLSFDKAEIYIPFVLGSYVLGHLLSFVSSITVERYSVWTIGYPSKYLTGLTHKGYFSVDNPIVTNWLLRGVVAALLLPVSILDAVLGNWCKMRLLYAKSLDPLLIEMFRLKVYFLLEEMGEVKPTEHGTALTNDFFRYVYHYTVEKAPNHLPKMQNYVALFGFLRTLTLISVLFFWGLLGYLLSHAVSVWLALGLLTGTAMLCYLFYMGFVKFYRRFTLESLMAMAVTFQGKVPNSRTQG